MSQDILKGGMAMGSKVTLKEERIHGTPLYPVSLYEYSCRAGEPLLHLHWHDELEFLMVTRGKALFRVGVDDYELQPGEAFFVNSGELHSGYSVGDADCSFTALVFHPDLLRSGRYDLVEEKYIRPLLLKKHAVPVHLTEHTAAQRELLELLKQVFQVNRDTAPLFEMTTKGLLHLILSKLILLGGPADREPRPSVDPYKIDRVKTAVEFIHVNCGKPIRLRDLAQKVSMSEAYFCRFFKEVTTKSPMDYINQIRIQKAAGLLKDTDNKIMEIALDVGFNNLSYFIGVFKQSFGCTPSVYRKRVRTMPVWR